MAPEEWRRQASVAGNARDIAGAWALLPAAVAWPNGLEGGTVHGHAGGRTSWSRQWRLSNPRVEPGRLVREAEGLYVAQGQQGGKDRQGGVLTDRLVSQADRLEQGQGTSLESRACGALVPNKAWGGCLWGCRADGAESQPGCTLSCQAALPAWQHSRQRSFVMK